MSTVIALKEAGTLILATDSRSMNLDCTVASDATPKIFAIGPEMFIAPSGWITAGDFQLAKARELIGASGTTDIRVVAELLARESIPNLEVLAETLRSVQHGREDIRQMLDGQLQMHVIVLAGRTANGELGFVSQVFRVQAGHVVCRTQEYFGREWKLYTSSGDPAKRIFQEDPTIMDGAPIEAVRKLIAALKGACPTIGGADQIVALDNKGVRWISQLVRDGLESSDALFAGDATFARAGGGKITINSAGLALADVNTGTPNATVAIASTGVTVAKGTGFNVKVDASGVLVANLVTSPTSYVQILNTGVGIVKGAYSVQVTGSNIVLNGPGSSSVTITSSSVDIVNGALSAVNGTQTVTVSGSAVSGAPGMSIVDTSTTYTTKFLSVGMQVNRSSIGDTATYQTNASFSYPGGYSSSVDAFGVVVNGVRVVAQRSTVRPVTLADVINQGVANGWWV
jgi:hypothetical protein